MKFLIKLYGIESRLDSEKALALLKKKALVLNFDFASSIVEVETKESFEKIRNAIVGIGFDCEQLEKREDKTEDFEEVEIKNQRNTFLLSAIFSFPLLLLMLSDFNLFVLPLLVEKFKGVIGLAFILPVLFVNKGIFVKGVKSALAQSPSMETLISLGVSAAVIYSTAVLMGFLGFYYFEAAAIILTFIALGKYLEGLARGRTSQAIKKLLGLQAKNAVVIRNGKEIEISINEVIVGDLIIVKPGGKIPVDGIVVDGESYVDESMVTGESIPVHKKKNAVIIGATINQNGTLTLKATKVGKDTLLAQIIKLVQEAQSSKAPIQELVDKISAVFVPIVLIIAILVFTYWLFVGGKDFNFALTAFVAVLVIACPCALGLATPTAIMVSTGLGAQNGILFKNSTSLQKVKDVNAVLLDKTGTITLGKPQVTNITFAQNANVSEDEILAIAASAEKLSEHPIANAIVNLAKEKKIHLSKASNFKAITARGVQCTINGKKVLAGNAELIKENKISITPFLESKISQLESQANTIVVIASESKVIGVIGVADAIKESSIEAVKQFKKMNFKVVMLTGDNERTATAIASQAGINEVYSKVLPHQKEEKVRELQKKGFKVAMIGDGINDSPALAAADVGIAIGSGTDVAIETGDVILVKSNLLDAIKAIKIGKFTMAKIKENLIWAFLFNVIGIPIAAGALYPFTQILLSPVIAGAAMAFSSVAVTTNSALMKLYKP